MLIATIRDVAKLAQVSPSTVSRFLSGKLRVSDSTQKRIVSAIEKLNYKSNLIARSLARRQSEVVGLVVPSLSNFFYARLAEAVVTAARKMGYRVLLCLNVPDSPEKEEYIDLFSHKLVDGLLYVGLSTQGYLGLLKSVLEGLPVVLLDDEVRVVEGVFNSVLVDSYLGAFLVTEYLISLGHQEIAFIGGNPNLFSSRERFRGFVEAMRKHGLQIDENLVLFGEYTQEWGSIAFDRLVASKDRFPTAIFASCDVIAIGFMEKARMMGLKIPEDFSIAGFDDIATASFVYPPLTTVRQPYEELGETALALLKEVMSGKTKQYRRILLEPKLIIRSSTGKPKREVQSRVFLL